MKTILKISLLSVILFAFASAAFASDIVIYNSIPNPQPPNLPSEPYQAVQSGEFGGLIQFAGPSS